MKYNPDIHHRRSIRLQGYNYSQNGFYFITICVQNRECLFGEIRDGLVKTSDYGKFASRCCDEIPTHFPDIVLHESVIMPNHVHGIIEIAIPDVGANVVGANNYSPLHGTSRTIGSIIRGYKIGVTKLIGHSIWQRNYFEHVIRDNNEYDRIARYIRENPQKWHEDRLFTEEKIHG